MDLSGSPMDPNESPEISMDPNDSTWIPMNPNGSQDIPMDPSQSKWIQYLTVDSRVVFIEAEFVIFCYTPPGPK